MDMDRIEIQHNLNSKAVVSPLLFGNNLEHTRNNVHNGISAQMLENRKFAGKPSCVGGCAAEWKAIGDKAYFALLGGDEAYTRHADDYHMNRDLERNAQRITSYTDERCGMAQSGLQMENGRDYEFSIVTKAIKNCELTIEIVSESGQRIADSLINVAGGRDWEEAVVTVKAEADCENASLRITFTGANTIVIGAVSLMPADHYHGMRMDVIEKMREMGIRILRWPGGNFAGEYNWKDGLLSRNMRSPLKSYLGLETQPHSMGFDYHEINTDDFVAVCRAIGAEPFITINPTWNTPEETAQWVEYCNGDENTEYGRLRIARGYTEPYNVKYWSLGNEFGYGHMEGMNTPAEYAKAVRKQADAMLKVTPDLKLCSSGPYPNTSWAQDSALALSDITSFVSLHHYSQYPAFTNPETYKEEYEAFISTVDYARDLARRLRKDLKNDPLKISFDEWNSWYAWYRPESVCDGIWAAAMMHMFINEAAISGIEIGCHFEAVNEGAIIAYRTPARLTTIGRMLAVMKQHAEGTILYADRNVVATLKEGVITTTLINTAYDENREYAVPEYGEILSGTCYSSESIVPHTIFEESEAETQLTDKTVRINMPPHSVAVLVQK